MLQCYNKGCGNKFDPDKNNEDSCTYHPGEPKFHDAKKIWQCCNKYATDFTEFLNIKGCKTGPHNNTKVVEPITTEKSVNSAGDDSATDKLTDCLESVLSMGLANGTPVGNRISQPVERPPSDEPMQKIDKVTIAQSLKTLLETRRKKLLEQDETDMNEKTGLNISSDAITIGTSCKNSGCKSTYSGSSYANDLCYHHTGVPIFHEGMKFWTCCQRKTSDFDAFMQQAGCTTGQHAWTEKDKSTSFKLAGLDELRYDWFQLPGNITISFYVKTILPDSLCVEANQTRVKLSFSYCGSQVTAVPTQYSKEFTLNGIIDPAKSTIKLLGTKLELILAKGEARSWPRLEINKSEETDTAETRTS